MLRGLTEPASSSSCLSVHQRGTSRRGLAANWAREEAGFLACYHSRRTKAESAEGMAVGLRISSIAA